MTHGKRGREHCGGLVLSIRDRRRLKQRILDGREFGLKPVVIGCRNWPWRDWCHCEEDIQQTLHKCFWGVAVWNLEETDIISQRGHFLAASAWAFLDPTLGSVCKPSKENIAWDHL